MRLKLSKCQLLMIIFILSTLSLILIWKITTRSRTQNTCRHLISNRSKCYDCESSKTYTRLPETHLMREISFPQTMPKLGYSA